MFARPLPAARAGRPCRIVIADDHAVVRDGLRGLVEGVHDLEVVGEAPDEEAACRLVDELAARGEAPDVVVMDVSMPGSGSGAGATARIREGHPGVRVLALSMHEDRAYLRSLLEAGASGYVLKRSAADELIRAVRTVATGGTHIDPALSAVVVGGLVRAGGAGGAPGLPAGAGGGVVGEVAGLPLSEREGSVLRLIAEGYTNKEVAVRIRVSVKSVETYKARGIEKLGLDGRAELMRYALAKGWLQ